MRNLHYEIDMRQGSIYERFGSKERIVYGDASVLHRIKSGYLKACEDNADSSLGGLKTFVKFAVKVI